MNKTERYQNLKETLREITEQKMNLISVKSNGPEKPYGCSTTEQEYIVWFSNCSRHLLLSTEAVKFAIEENIGKIKESILYFARQNIEQYLEEAKQERQNQLTQLNNEKINLKVKTE